MRFDIEMNETKKASGDGLFIKLKDGESITGVLRGEVYPFYSVFNSEAKKSEVVDSSNPDGKFRFRINMLIKKGNGAEAKILEMGSQVYKQLQKLQKAGYDLSRQAITIERVGLKLDTEYFVTVVPKGEVTDEVNEQFNKIELNKLEK